MLQCRNNILRLNTPDRCRAQQRGMKGILAHILECATIPRVPHQIDASREQDIEPLRMRLAANHLAACFNQIRIPRRSLGNTGR